MTLHSSTDSSNGSGHIESGATAPTLTSSAGIVGRAATQEQLIQFAEDFLAKSRTEIHPRDVAEVSSLIIARFHNQPIPEGWRIADGAFLAHHYAQLYNTELAHCLSHGSSLYKFLSNAHTRGLHLTDSDRERFDCVQKLILQIPPDSALQFQGKGWYSVYEALRSGGKAPMDLPIDVFLGAIRDAAKARALAKIGNTLELASGEIEKAFTTSPSPAQHEEGGPRSRFIIHPNIERNSIPFNESWLRGNEETCPSWVFNTDWDSSLKRARGVVQYLEHLTTASTKTTAVSESGARAERAVLRVDTREQFTELARRSIENGTPIQFSLYLSLEKFANPVDTRNSEVDFGDLRVTLELKNLVESVKAITGMAPHITIINESPANTKFTNANSALYKEQFTHLLAQKGLAEHVTVRDFDKAFFIQYLEKSGHSSEAAHSLFNESLRVLHDVYQDILARRLEIKPGESSGPALRKRFPGISDSTHLSLTTFADKHFQEIQAETQRAIQSELRGGIDPSIIFPTLPVAFLQELMETLPQKSKANGDCKHTRNVLTEQAKYQGVYFKVMMRLRHFLPHSINGGPVLGTNFIPLSITSAENKLTLELGRTSDTGITTGDNKPVAGVLPQHGSGVIVNGRIVSVPWREICRNPADFHDTRVTVGGVTVRGHTYTMRGIVSDLDGTLKERSSPVSDEVFELMNDALLKGIPFGLATGRSAESIERIIRRPFIAYLTARGHNPSDPRYDKLLISGNNGALTTVGLARPRVIEEHKLPLLELDRLPHDSFVRCALRRAYAMSSSAEAQRFSDGLPANTYDEYALYLNGEHFSRATSALTGEVLTPWALADEANEEFNRYGVDLRAHATKDGIDIVKGNVDKGLALNRYRDLAGIDETESSRVLCLGDSPAGNDRELLIHGGGRADIAPLGVSAVVEYARAMLGLPRDEASPKQTNAPESTGDTELEKEAA